MLPRCTMPFLLALALAAPVAGGGIDLDLALDDAAFTELTDHLAEGIAMPLGPARSLGPGGIEVGVGGAWVDLGEDPAWWDLGVDDVELLSGGARALHADARLGLPWGMEVGGQVGRLAGETYWGFDLRRRFAPGGVLRPDLAVRGSFTRLHADELDLRVASVDVVASKSFAVVTPYVGAGMRLSRATGGWDELPELTLEQDELTPVLAAGAELDLPLGRLRLEVRRGASTAFVVGAGFGFGGLPSVPLLP